MFLHRASWTKAMSAKSPGGRFAGSTAWPLSAGAAAWRAAGEKTCWNIVTFCGRACRFAYVKSELNIGDLGQGGHVRSISYEKGGGTIGCEPLRTNHRGHPNRAGAAHPNPQQSNAGCERGSRRGGGLNRSATRFVPDNYMRCTEKKVAPLGAT